MQLTGTFLDEISHDIPHQNWGRAEWDADFAAMKAIGIDTVILIRSGHKRWLTYPSEVLIEREGCYRPPVDLVDMFLSLAEKYEMAFYFGTYDSGNYWHQGEFARELDLNRAVVDEVWAKYGGRKAFRGLVSDAGGQPAHAVDHRPLRDDGPPLQGPLWRGPLRRPARADLAVDGGDQGDQRVQQTRCTKRPVLR